MIRAAAAYLDSVLRMNCTLVANDLDERVLESRRLLEGEIQKTLQQVTASATRALPQARAAHAAGASAIAAALARLDGLEGAIRVYL